MIDGSNTSATPRWLRTAAWIAVICALPLGIVYCSQPDTPAAIDDASEAPAVEGNDAAQAGDGDDASRDRGMARVNQLRRDLRAQVAAGEITGEQARQRISRALQRLEAAGGEAAGDQASSEQPSERDGTARINHLRRDLRARVAAGEITEEQMRQRVSRALQRLEASRSEGGNR
ncbi:MAG: hypothetical protein F4087_13955 [Gemmatimonadetes bacterium]|nr:hypothetical protein [Gemmatimonadota bacterium]MYD13804.1 hypothetical protein [Gemmatimonadota bacterium]MYI65067.1 hypothetical protein [Gemmatimonadota bacterium]MYJ69592.1 hypothetical protein [Gemmatimonadota bacterium]